MGMVAEHCPQCSRVTRCFVAGGDGFVGGILFGVPFYLPLGSERCVCGECGCQFHSPRAAEDRAVSPEVAAGLDTDGLVGLTNPELREAQLLDGLRADPRLGAAFRLLDRLPAGPLRAALRTAVLGWPALGEPARGELLARVEACGRAEEFARGMADRYSAGAAGCLVGLSLSAAVGAAAALLPGKLTGREWAAAVVLGLVAGGVACWLVWKARDRRWVRDVLLPEAARADVRPGWVLAVLEGSAAPRGSRDTLGTLRDVAPALRAALPGDDAARGFAPPPTVLACPACGGKVRVPADRGRLAVRCPRCRHGWDWAPGG